MTDSGYGYGEPLGSVRDCLTNRVGLVPTYHGRKARTATVDLGTWLLQNRTVRLRRTSVEGWPAGSVVTIAAMVLALV